MTQAHGVVIVWSMPDDVTAEQAKRGYRKKSVESPPSRVYMFGADEPVTNLDLVKEEFWRAKKFYNALVEIEHTKYAKQQELERSYPELSDALATVETLLTEKTELNAKIKLAKAGEGRPDKADLDRMKALKVELVAAKTVLAEARNVTRPLQEEGKKTIAADGYTAMKKIRSEAGLRHGTYDRVGRAIKTAVETKWKTARRDKVPYTPPVFKSFDGGGYVGTQLQPGLTVTELFSCKDTRIQVEPLREDWALLGRHQRRKHHRTVARIRVGSNEDRSPIWAEVPIYLHRSLPSDGLIKWAYLVRKRVGRQFEWTLQLTVESESFRSPTREAGKAVAIDIGWRGGRRVAYAVDSDGNRNEITVPERSIEGRLKPDELRSIRDQKFDLVKGLLKNFLTDREGLDDTFVQAVRHLDKWRSPQRVVRLMRHWRNARIGGDEVIFTQLELYLKKDGHLLDWEANQREGVNAHRTEWYHVVAAKLATDYTTIVLEDAAEMNLTRFATKREPSEGDPSDGKKSRKNARWAAPGEFREILRKAAVKFGAKVVQVDPAYTTRTCHECGCNDPWEDPKEVTHLCVNCGVTFDRDDNAAKNLLKLADIPVGQEMGVLALPNYTAKNRNHPDHLARRQRKLDKRARCSQTAA